MKTTAIKNTEERAFPERTEQFERNFGSQIAFWRENPHRFAEEYLGFHLHPFQKYLLWSLNNETLSRAILYASRGLGKTFIVALFVIVKSILYPNTKCIVASPLKDQATNFIKVIKDLAKEYPMVAESIVGGIDGITTPTNGRGKIEWKGGSTTISVASASARGLRCNLLILDEFVWIKFSDVSDILRKTMTKKREPKYLHKKKYANLADLEHNTEICLSSIDTVSDWGYIAFQDYCENIAKGLKDYNVYSLPYQFGTESGVIDKKIIELDMREGKTSLDSFKKEMEVIPYGEAKNALFKYEEMNNARKLQFPLIPITTKEYIKFDGDKTKYKYYRKRPSISGFVRLLVADIAVSTRKNADNSVFMIMDGTPNKNNEYNIDVRYIEIPENSDIEPQCMRLKQLFYDLECDYCMIDANGALGLSAYSILQSPTNDEERGIVYPAWGICSMSPEITEVEDAKDCDHVVYGMKVSGMGASEKIHEMNIKSKLFFERGKIGFLKKKETIMDYLDDNFEFSVLKSSNDPDDKDEALRLIAPYEQTESLIDEGIKTQMVKLPSGRYTIQEGEVDKDRIITFMYGIYLFVKLEQDLKVVDTSYSYQQLEAIRADIKVKKKEVMGGYTNNRSNFSRANVRNPFGFNRRNPFG